MYINKNNIKFPFEVLIKAASSFIMKYIQFYDRETTYFMRMYPYVYVRACDACVCVRMYMCIYMYMYMHVSTIKNLKNLEKESKR
jgi:hypothetical protein